MEDSQTYNLFKRLPSFLNGMGSIIGDTKEDLYDISKGGGHQADENAIYSDWKAVGIELEKSCPQNVTMISK
jgi:hypothetical protein